MLTDLLRQQGFRVPAKESDRPEVGVSACLLGRRVRYDGDHQYHALIGDELATLLNLREACPEVGIGLPVPREPIQVVRLDGQERVRAVTAPHRDVTDALHGYADRFEGPLDGFILKARSPSCGLGTTPRHDAAGRETGLTDGAFAARLQQRFPHLPLCNDSDLEDEAVLRDFILAVYRHRHQRAG